MWRTRAILSLLLGDVAGIRSVDNSQEDHFESLSDAKRKALGMVVLCWAAIAVLLTIREHGLFSFRAGAMEDTLFSVVILAVAVYSGFRLGQLEKFRSVEQVSQELLERDPES